MTRTRDAIAALVALLLTLGLLGPASALTEATSKYGGTLVVSISADPDTIDPTFSNSPFTRPIWQTMCLRLYDYDARLQRVPLLAAALPVLSKDKLSYTIELRKGIQFNDGTPFNAQAVVTTAEREMTDPASSRADSYGAVESISAAGPYTVVFHLKARDSSFDANPWVESPTQLAKLGANFGAAPVCAGPFMFDHRVAGDHVTVIKSPYWYDRKNVFLDKIVFKPLTAPAATAALKAGDIQVVDRVSTTELDGIRQTSSLRVIQGYGLGWSGIQINIGNRNGAGNPPYPNVGTPLASSAKLRQAFEEAIDRNTLNRVVFDGLMQVTCTPIAPANTFWYERTKVPCTPYDPKHARKLVAESGFSKPTVRMTLSSSPDLIRLAQFIQAQEAAVGVDVVLDTVDSATHGTRRASGTFDASLAGFLTGGVDPSATIHLESSSPQNYPGYSSPRLELILANGLKATSIEARSTLYRAAQQIVHDARPYIPLYNSSNFVAFSASVAGVQLAPNGVLNVAGARYE